VVCFLELDQELTAPRFRAGEEALALLARASRLVGGSRGRVVVQTRIPGHPAIEAARRADPAILRDCEAPLRAELRLPPASALCAISGPSAPPYVTALRERLAADGPAGELLDAGDGRWLLRASDTESLSALLSGLARPPGRLRLEVDPQRL